MGAGPYRIYVDQSIRSQLPHATDGKTEGQAECMLKIVLTITVRRWTFDRSAMWMWLSLLWCRQTFAVVMKQFLHDVYMTIKPSQLYYEGIAHVTCPAAWHTATGRVSARFTACYRYYDACWAPKIRIYSLLLKLPPVMAAGQWRISPIGRWLKPAWVTTNEYAARFLCGKFNALDCKSWIFKKINGCKYYKCVRAMLLQCQMTVIKMKNISSSLEAPANDNQEISQLIDFTSELRSHHLCPFP